jgi:hypothetical protein
MRSTAADGRIPLVRGGHPEDMLRLVPRPLVTVGIGLVVAGFVLLAAGAEVGALAVGGLGAVLLAGAVFYAVGRSEDVERERGESR